MPHGETDLEQAFEQVFSDEDGNLVIPAEMRAALIAGLIKAVEFATTSATEALRKLGIRETIFKTAVITAVITAAIAIPVTYVLSTEGRNHLCHLITRIAGTQQERILENKASTERFRRESTDRLGLSPHRFEELIAEGERREGRQLETYAEVAHEAC